MSKEYTIILEKEDEGGYSSHCLQIPWAHGQGETREEAIESAKNAIQLCQEVLDEELKDKEKQELNNKAKQMVKVSL